MYALKDFASAAKNIRSWAYLAAKRIQIDYRRNLLGIFWIILGFGISAGGIGWLMSELRGRPIEEHIPYVAFGLALFTFMSSLTVEGCSTFLSSKPMMLQLRVPRSVFPISLILKRGFVLLFNLFTACIVAAIVGWRPEWQIVYALPALALYAITAYGVAVTVGIFSLVIRDISELIASIMRIALFFTPVIWTVDRRFGAARIDANENIGLMAVLTSWNPFSHFLAIARDPFLGVTPLALNWIVSVCLCVLFLGTAALAMQIYGRRLAYWL